MHREMNKIEHMDHEGKGNWMTTQRVCSRQTSWLGVGAMLGLMFLLAACSMMDTPAACPELEPLECPAAACPEPVLIEDVWASSGHADAKSEAFAHWDEDDPPEIPVECAMCHSRPGYINFLGVDGTKAGTVDNPVQTGSTVTCYTCHNEAALVMESVTFPSGVRVGRLGPEARCILCHQGRASTVTVNNAIAELGLTEEDTISEELGLVNSHAISGATPFGAEVQGAYEYEGQTYRGRYVRGDDFFSCIQCHDSHSLEVEPDACRECHTSAEAELIDIRVDTTDYDGDGDLDEGIAGEIETLHQSLLVAIQAYAVDIAGRPIVFDSHAYPYFFIDSDLDGEADPDETIFPNQYNAWTPRLLRAAYNLNYVLHDPGAYAHNSDYIIQVLYDSLSDVGGDTSGMGRPPGVGN